MSTGRDDPSVIAAFAVGAVACQRCSGVHIDLVDEDGSVLATGFLSFEHWLLLVDEVMNQIDVIDRLSGPAEGSA